MLKGESMSRKGFELIKMNGRDASDFSHRVARGIVAACGKGAEENWQ
jgi:hypothetical protein